MFSRFLPSTLSTSERRLLGFYLAAALVLRLGMLLLPLDTLIAYKIPDDAMYYFAIAKNLAHGHGLSFDGVHPANGIHPLWLFTILPIWVAGLQGWAAVYAVLIVQSVLDVIVCWWMLRVALLVVDKEHEYRWLFIRLAILSYAFNAIVIVRGIGGLETTTTALMLIIWTERFVLLQRREASRRDLVLFGIASGLLFLARTDMAVIMLISVVISYRSLRTTIPKLTLSVAIAALIAAPWLLWNLATFGSIIQSSAEAVPFFAQKKYDVELGVWGKYPYLLKNALLDWVKVFYYAGGPLPLFMLPVAWYYRSKRVRQSFTRELTPIVIAAIVLIFFHSFVRGFIRDWYVEQLIPVIAIWVIGFYYSQLEGLRGIRKQDLRDIPLAFVGCSLVWLAQFEYHRPKFESQQAMYHAGVSHIQSLPANSTVAALNSGYYGYFAPDSVRVLNIDGVVNSEAVAHIKSGDLGQYLHAQNVTHIIDFPTDIVGYRNLIDHRLTEGFSEASTIGFGKDSLVVYTRLTE